MYKSKIYKMIFKNPLPFLIFMGFLLMGCENMTHQETESPKTGEEVVATLDSLFHELASLEKNAPGLSDEVVQLNESIRRTVEDVRTSDLLMEINKVSAKKKHDYTFTLSDDKKLGVFSWRTRMDNTGNRIKNIALYGNGDNLEPSSLYDTPITYDKIYQVESYKGETLYILHGHLASGDGRYFRMNAYTIKNGYLEEAPAFPENESSISIAQILKNPGFSDSLGFKVEMNGSRILFPEMRDTSMIRQSLAFNGKRYMPEQHKD